MAQSNASDANSPYLVVKDYSAKTAKILDQQIIPQLLAFEPISLPQMDTVSLMNRIDTKFIFPRSQLRDLLSRLQHDYRLLEINAQRCLQYQTLYFDTAAMEMYHKHHNGKLNRLKIRQRNYIDSNLNFFEIKNKTNTGRTIKQRIKIAHINTSLEASHIAWIRRNTPYQPAVLQAQLWNKFSRLTLVNTDFSERLTIDLHIAWRLATPPTSTTTANTKPHWFRTSTDFCVAEVKRNGTIYRSGAIGKFRQHRLRPCRFSKYCIGSALLKPQLKKNLFQTTLRMLGVIQP